MCGIWLFFTKNGFRQLGDFNLYKSFMRFKHRGPENTDFKILDQYSTIIGFHRLALNGLVRSTANQPFMFDTDEKVDYVMCNGEIYNYKELAQKYDIQLQTGSDCEILYPLYNKIGAARLMEELDGEFALIICEINKKTKEVKLTIGRDQCGIRPLFIAYSKDEICLSSELKGIPVLDDSNFKIHQFPPRSYLELSSSESLESLNFKQYFDLSKIETKIFERQDAMKLIREEFIESVKSRMMCDREFCCLLSGGLDSSLASAIACDIYKSNGKKLKTFCIGIDPESPDIKYAQIVANHIGSEHTTVILPENVWLDAIMHVVDKIESYDITTVRASTGQYLISKWISENTDIKALLIGDGSDELTGGYIYMLKAPNHDEFHSETLKLLNNIHYFDVLRSDRGISSNGLEARVPFLRKKFLEAYLSIDVNLRKPKDGEMEKILLRDAFKETNLLPMEVLYRKKEAFSDGVSTHKRSWFTILQENINKMYTDEEFKLKQEKYTHNKPPSKEALYYRETFEKQFGTKEETANNIPYFWLPNSAWVGDIKEPSARVLSHYSK
jgi:asparagine synthase (glutamine-hydrolysing)